MQIGHIINGINTKHCFKVIAFLILSFPTFQNYFQFQNILIAIITPEHTCVLDDDHKEWSISDDQCALNYNQSSEKCTQWIFSSEPVGETMVSEYSLVCDKSHYGEMLLIVWYLTSLMSPLAGWLADKFGRKKITILYLSLEIFTSIRMVYATTFTESMILRIFLGISSSGVIIAFVWLMESVNLEFRDFIGSFFYMYGCIAYMLSPLNSYITKDWRTTQMISIIPSFLYVFIYFIPESPRWLVASGKTDEALDSIKHIASINKMKIKISEKDIAPNNDYENIDSQKALKSHVFVYRTITAILLQVTNSLFYSAVAINLTILNSNIFLSMFLLGLMETPSLFLSFFSLRYQKRKVALLTFGGIGSVLFWLNAFFDKDVYWESFVRLAIGCVAKTAICCVNQTSMTFITELFPTSHRSCCMVCSQLFNFLSFIGAIYINKLSSKYFFLPMTIYLVLLFSSILLAFFTLPETKGLPFPETLYDQSKLTVNKEEEYLKYMEDKYIIKDDSKYISKYFVSEDSDDEISKKRGRSYKGRVLKLQHL